MIELLGPMPKSFALAGKQLQKFFEYDTLTGQYNFRRIHGLKHVPLKKLLQDKYRIKTQEAEMLADFLLPMIKWLPKERASAQKMLDHPWLKMPDDYNFKMDDLEYKKYKLK
jgi:serine/threonine-protein kinase SRPK3